MIRTRARAFSRISEMPRAPSSAVACASRVQYVIGTAVCRQQKVIPYRAKTRLDGDNNRTCLLACLLCQLACLIVCKLHLDHAADLCSLSSTAGQGDILPTPTEQPPRAECRRIRPRTPKMSTHRPLIRGSLATPAPRVLIVHKRGMPSGLQ